MMLQWFIKDEKWVAGHSWIIFQVYASRSRIHNQRAKRWDESSVKRSIWSTWTSAFGPAGGASGLDPKWDDVDTNQIPPPPVTGARRH